MVLKAEGRNDGFTCLGLLRNGARKKGLDLSEGSPEDFPETQIRTKLRNLQSMPCS